ncbi:hypothetical protein JCM3765_001680 [Sporobolomyces pararoseus]
MVLGMNPPPVPPKFGTFEYAAIPISPSPAPSSPRTASFHSTHVRKRSSFDINFDTDIAIQLDGTTTPPNSEKIYGRILSEKSSGENEPLNVVGAGSGKGYIAWKDGRVTRWLGGLATSEATGKRKGRMQSVFTAQMTAPPRCNPYEEHGVLNVNTTVPSENFWQPLSASPDCQPIDYMTLLRKATVENNVSPIIKFVQNRTIVLYGDSIDRDHNEHLCQFLSGWHEMIGRDHPLSPPTPPGQEIPPVGYANFMNGKREWPDWLQSRPWVCHVPKLNFRIVNVFHYGFQEPEFDNGYIMTHPHFYPPATVEERFSQVLVPLLEGLSKRYNISAVPDILSVAPGFWSQLRQSVADQSAQKVALEKGMSLEEAKVKFDPWRSMSQGEKKWFEGRMYEILRHCARGWKCGKDVYGKKVRPTILWRAPHPIKETNTVPFSRTVTVDQIGRSVVADLIEESRAAWTGASTWKAWSRQISAKALGWKKESKNEALNEDFLHRLRVDEWGSHMIGQTRYFRDEVHPLALPGSWLYGNMLFNQLRMTVDEESRR